MRFKTIAGIGIVSILIIVIVSYGSININQKKTKQIEKRKSYFYRGLPLPPRHSESYVKLPEDTVVLDPVLQGDIAEHDFIIQNTTNETLSIKNAKSCCGFIMTSFSPEIHPGESGKISVIVITDKYGGKTVNGKILAELNDSTQLTLTIHASIYIEKFAEISHHELSITGSHNQNLEKTTTIIPDKDFPFKITGIKAKKGLQINFNYKEVITPAGEEYLITVSNIQKKAGAYRDMLFIQTDNPKRPEIRIRISGQITESE